AKIVATRAAERPAVVVSAMGGVTDRLVAAGNAAAAGDREGANDTLQLIRERHAVAAEALLGSPHGETLRKLQPIFEQCLELLAEIASFKSLSGSRSDRLLSFGELLSSILVADAFRALRLPSVHVDARDCVITDESFTHAVPDMERTTAATRRVMQSSLDAGCVPVLGGFIARSTRGTSTTLGRGGSDFSAAIIGAALGATRIEIWTDVDGILTTDPRLCPEAEKIDEISFDEAAELAYFGAKVLHPATLIPAIDQDIPVQVLNSRNPGGTGTVIRAHARRGRSAFRAIAVKKGVSLINVKAPRMLMSYGYLRELFQCFEHHGIPADLVSTSEVSVSVAFDSNRNVDALAADLRRLGRVEVEPNAAIICLVGENIRGIVGIAAEVFGVVARAGVNLHMISQGASEINISFVVEEKSAAKAVRALHEHLFQNGHAARFAPAVVASEPAQM
ncbi:MAG TPA: lysine-sensitive aspartokinase 3, partial [candidate division Zixibacteria bacterium]|nr:lysine-sensitive aspartokinase 3 [candidate division Zixibacteria bacterium]